MLVVISDLHLTDGLSAATTPAAAFALLAQRLRELALAASWRADGLYRPIETFDLLLLGDTLDLLRSPVWLDGDARPWSGSESPALATALHEIVAGVLRHNGEAAAILRSLGVEGGLCLPLATANGQPAAGHVGFPVRVRTHFLVGNHDWPLHLPGPAYDELRRVVAGHLGLASSSDRPFPHDPHECGELLDVLRRHRVWARHGDVFDPLSFQEVRDASSLGDAIVVDLTTRFLADVEHELGNQLPPAAAHGLCEIDNIRPLLLIPVWIDGLLERCALSPALRRRVKQLWDARAEALLALPFVRQCDADSPFDLLDGLAAALRFSRRASTGWAERTLQWLHRLRGAAGPSYVNHALAEPDFRNRRARHIVYGHTHYAESAPLDASHADGFVLNQLYFNSGAWRRVYRPTVAAPQGPEFIAAETLAMLAFYHGDERGGRAFECWSGMLAPVADAGLRRLDAASHAAATAATAATPSGGPFTAPHFSLGVGHGAAAGFVFRG